MSEIFLRELFLSSTTYLGLKAGLHNVSLSRSTVSVSAHLHGGVPYKNMFVWLSTILTEWKSLPGSFMLYNLVGL